MSVHQLIADMATRSGDALRGLASQFLTLAEKQDAIGPLIVGHRLVGTSLACTGDLLRGRTHLDRAVALFDPIKHRSLAVRFGQDVRVATLSYRAMALWMLGYPDGALADSEQALADAREASQAASLMYAWAHAGWIYLWRGNYAEVENLSVRLVPLAEEKGAILWKALGGVYRACVTASTSNSEAIKSKAIESYNSEMESYNSTGSTVWVPGHQAIFGAVNAELGQFDKAWNCIRKAIIAIEDTKEAWWEAEVNRIAGEIALRSPEPDATNAEVYLERALEIARQQQAKSWELRASMSLARLWRDQGKVQQARELLAPVYGWFIEGFDTLDLKQAKALLEELAA